MRKPVTPGSTPEPDPPEGGKALGRARQFAQSRGLPAPTPVGTDAAAATPAAKAAGPVEAKLTKAMPAAAKQPPKARPAKGVADKPGTKKR